jgi:hypothetical protein
MNKKVQWYPVPPINVSQTIHNFSFVDAICTASGVLKRKFPNADESLLVGNWALAVLYTLPQFICDNVSPLIDCVGAVLVGKVCGRPVYYNKSMDPKMTVLRTKDDTVEIEIVQAPYLVTEDQKGQTQED